MPSFMDLVGGILGEIGSTPYAPVYGPQEAQLPTIPTTSVGAVDDYWGSGPGLDWWDIPDVIGRVLTASPYGQIGAGGVIDRTPLGPGLPDIAEAEYGNGQSRVRSSSPTVRRGLYIGGVAPGFWHTTPVRTVYDRHTGVPRQVGGNRYPNRLTLAQDDTGEMQFFAPVEIKRIGFKYRSAMTGNPRARKHTHRTTHKHRPSHKPRHHHHRKRITAGHRHTLTQKQLAAGFGGKAHMRHR